MYSVIRAYTTVPTLAAELKRRSKDIETVIGSVPGFRSYYLLETHNGATTITVCDDRAGCDESTKRAANWLKQNLPNLLVGPPQVIAGEVTFNFSTSSARV
jgi:hypothetical protein